MFEANWEILAADEDKKAEALKAWLMSPQGLEAPVVVTDAVSYAAWEANKQAGELRRMAATAISYEPQTPTA